ncbi:type IV conjugative transfer system protein TraL [Thauera butanivorans]|uniref:type IV conjugative transfer system protein TraL n=1 Tax=Thauera butanivorans TaxID=86174 RepID=UPI000837ECED|nr:type IV conjugative transfer system protein TraL [Thauera butanivorans]
MDQNGESRVLRRCDDPWKLGLWELDVALPFSMCLMFGLMKGSAISMGVSVLVGWFIAYRVTRIKTRGHPRHFRHLLYWIMPELVGFSPKGFPPSAQYEMVG